MKYILTGGSGFIGQEFSRVLSKKIIYNFDLYPSKIENNFREVSILDKQNLNSHTLKTDDNVTLIHLAAVHFDFQKNYYETNIDGTKNVIDYIEKNKQIKTLIFFSSVAVYGDSNFGKDEDSIKDANNDYGKSKLEAEKIILKWFNNNRELRDFKLIIVRPAVVFGEQNFGNVFNLIQQIKSSFFFNIGNGKNIKSIAYVRNLVDSVFFAQNNIKTNFFVYNYSDYPQLNILSLTKLISELTGKVKPLNIPLFCILPFTLIIDILEILLKKDLKFNTNRIKKFTSYSYFKSDKIRDLGFKQKYNLKSSLSNTIDWINSVNIIELRKQWYDRVSKL